MTDSKRGGPRPGAGRKTTDYQPEHADMAYRLSLLGVDDADLARFFGISVYMLERWKKRYPEFAEAIKNGQTLADANVAEALYRAAVGYQHTQTTTKYAIGDDGEKRVVEVVTVTREVPPNVEACIFWLYNRDPEHWQYPSRTGTTAATTEPTREPTTTH